MEDFSNTGHSTLIEELMGLIDPICTELGLELVDVQFQRESHGQVLRVTIDRPGGIGIDCPGFGQSRNGLQIKVILKQSLVDLCRDHTN